MARIIVTTDSAGERRLSATTEVLLDEHVDPVHLDSSHAAEQLMERLSWAVSDAEAAQPPAQGSMSHQ